MQDKKYVIKIKNRASTARINSRYKSDHSTNRYLAQKKTHSQIKKVKK